MRKKINFFDTTLRDGEQAPGNSMSVEQKVTLAKLIDTTNIDYIETGFPASSKDDFKATQLISSLNLNAKISVFSRAEIKDIKAAADAVISTKKAQIQIALTGSELHLKNKRNISIEQSIHETNESIQTAKSFGFEDISLGLEDATRGSIEYLQKIIQTAINNSATTIVLADTLGSALPHEIFNMVKQIKLKFKDKIALSIHCHNDLGLATANSLTAIEAGADCIQTTFCGIGERTGNTAVEEVATTLYLKSNHYQVVSALNLKAICYTCEKLSKLINHPISRNKPVIGDNAFSTEAGMHIHGLLLNPTNYELIDPKVLGRSRKFILGKHSGKSMIKKVVEDELNIHTNDTIVEKVYNDIINSNDSNTYKSPKLIASMYCSFLAENSHD